MSRRVVKRKRVLAAFAIRNRLIIYLLILQDIWTKVPFMNLRKRRRVI